MFVLQLNVGASLIGPPCSELMPGLDRAQSSSVVDGVVAEPLATVSVRELGVAPEASW